MDDIDTRLEQLARDAQGHPPRSAERQICLTRLLQLLTKSKRLSKPIRQSHQDRSGEFYDEALQSLYVHICEHIDSFDPERSTVVRWAVFLLNRRFINDAKKRLNPLTAKLSKGVQSQRLTIDDLEQHITDHQVPLPSEELKNYIEEDPGGILQSCCIKGHPNVTFKFLLLRRLAEYSWQEISEQLDIPIPTLSSFYQRQLKQFASKFTAYLSL